MSNEERRDSLADQAASWVPPWQRPTPLPVENAEPEPVEAPADLVSERPLDGPETTEIAEQAEAARAEAPADLGTGAPDPNQIPKDPEPDPDQADPSADLGMEMPLEGPPGTKISQAPNLAPADGGLLAEPAETGEAGTAASGRAAGRRRLPEPEPAPELDDAELRGALEAILLVVDEPVSELTLAQVLEQPAERVGAMLDEIAAGYRAAGHGFELRRAAGGWRLYTRPEYATYVERFVLDGQSVRLTQAALETLAVVAYKQPVTRSRISAIRGVNCDGVIRTLVSRGLVEECGTEPESGAFLYRTTTLFLEKLGLNTVDELPPLAPFLPDDVEELTDATR
ncbi:SMC-Scp complex subunit ScpB [Micromonospora sp. WMMD812]|uniref:SMC-Scp complex subunit ScpB n=1 Tax=Micromonospora sp. WMMD812 TaxID=3015152 RepID=UPI00248B2A0C|nr:SMC-Scp complex subunit ScpB [Micromonospora sp. WMMD812]WBB69560.1 SMC-Scp complex subunit ScpB [Micromonospora sp. WMMD812]